jgi:hypothetical protein
MDSMSAGYGGAATPADHAALARGKRDHAGDFREPLSGRRRGLPLG